MGASLDIQLKYSIANVLILQLSAETLQQALRPHIIQREVKHVHEFNLITLFTLSFPSLIFPLVFVSSVFPPQSLITSLFLFLNIPFSFYFATGDTLSFLPLLSQTDWVNYRSVCPILNEHSRFPSATLPISSRGLCLSESPDNDPSMLFF